MKVLITAVIALATTIGAQTPAPSTTDIQAYLSLTDSQVQSLQQLRTQQRQALRSTFQQIRQQEKNLRTQLANGSTDAAALGQILVDIQTLRKSIASSESASNTQALAILTTDQKTKLQTLQAAAALRPQIGQATALGLLTPAARADGAPGFGPALRRRGGPRAGFRGDRHTPPPQF